LKRIIISRTDSIGDVVLTLPMAGVIKKHLPDTEILFLGRGYTKPVIEVSRFIDEFHVFMVAEIARLADFTGIPVKIGTTHRLFSWLFCNHLVWFSRKQSDLHEAQLNLKLLKPLGIDVKLSREEIPYYYGLPLPQPLPNKGGEYPASSIQHPGSRFKRLENFSRLIDLLPSDRYEIFITGTGAERELMKDFLNRHQARVTDMTGKLTLPELMDFIRASDGLVAASTGPLHLAAAFGKIAVGLYAPMRPIYPARWAPLGLKASYLVLDKICNDCRKTLDCHCMKEITAEEVVEKLEEMRR